MNGFRVFSILCLLLLQTGVQASDTLWTPISVSQRSASGEQLKTTGQFYRVDSIKLRQQLSRASFEGRSESTAEIELPVSSGAIQRFTLEESPIMAAELAAKYPYIKTYQVRGIDNPLATGRLSIGSKGFHAMITDPSGTYYVDPDGENNYKAYRKNSSQSSEPFRCGVVGHDHDHPAGVVAHRPASRTAGSLRVYRLAVAGTVEYVNAVGGTVSEALEEVVIAINRVNEIYQRDLAIRLVLVGNNDELLYTGSVSQDPYTNSNELLMLSENQNNLDSVIGAANYDIGHVFGTGGGGIAEVGSVCTSFKAGGATGLFKPLGDAFYIDYVAHEMGHQFSADHSFNGTDGSCIEPNRWQASAYEPGSGSTIMSYAGICSDENIQLAADAMFHAGSINTINNFTTTGSGASCGSVLALNNPSEPIAKAGNNYTIPVSTPFMLTGTGTDADGHTLSYSWDQTDTGTATNATTLGTDLGDNPLMRSRLPQANPTRHFPQLDSTLNLNPDKAEVLPTTNRSLHFRLIARDGHSGYGFDDVTLTSVAAAGPFKVTSHMSAKGFTGGSTETVTWDVAGTDSNGINCSSVDIDLLMFNNGKTAYCEESLETNAANNGTVEVTLPDLTISTARFRVSCSDNIFYAISEGDITVNGSTVANSDCTAIVPGTEEHKGVNLVVDDPEPEPESGGSSSGSFGVFWLISLFSIALFRQRLQGKVSLPV